MKNMPYDKYKPYPSIELANRTWPNKRIEKAPSWCSVDLRDGNQALPIPMNVQEKIKFFNLLVEIGFKQIEIGFPSASQVEFDFLRTLVNEKLIPDDVTIQVLVQTRDHLIKRTFESLAGVKRAIVHFYNSTSTLQREVVFKKDQKEIIKIATDGAKLIKQLEKEHTDTEIIYQYSPESYTGTELDYAIEICHAVMDVVEPTVEKPIILNLPATVEMATPNLYADSIEYFINNMQNRDKAIISLHTHNDRGTGVAAAELAVMAGAQRVEGTLFGNGERTGNLDIVTMAVNMFSQGVDPKLDFTNLPAIRDLYEKVTKLTVPPRQPYAGELVYTAFSGSHQDAIAKGMRARQESKCSTWEVPYLPIDPKDVGRDYEAIIRINSQSGKGGMAYILEHEYGYKLPKAMHPEFALIIQEIADQTGQELSSDEIFAAFKKSYLETGRHIELVEWDIRTTKQDNAHTQVEAKINIDGEEKVINANGNGPVDAFIKGVKSIGFPDLQVLDYAEHALSEGSEARAVCYVQIKSEQHMGYGVGEDSNIALAPIKAVLSAMNRLF